MQQHGLLYGVSIPKESSKLADLLGVMWFQKEEEEASIPVDCELAQLIDAAVKVWDSKGGQRVNFRTFE